MKILIDIGHPAHVHFFKNLQKRLRIRGHNVIATLREKEVSKALLIFYGIDYIPTVGHSKSIVKKFIINLKRAYILRKLVKKHDIEIAMGIADYPLAWASKFSKCKALIFTDTEHVKIDKYFTFPFADVVITPSCFLKEIGLKQIRYDSYHELAYLHPKYFKPDPSILDYLGVKGDEKFVIMRFVSWQASHDIGQSGLNLEMKRKAVREFSKHARVFISSEGELPEDLKPHQIKIPPERMHDALAFATLFVGEGATMASECAMLGTPAIYVNSLTAGTLEEQEKYGLIFGYRNANGVLEKALELLRKPNLKQEWQKRREKMLSDKIDVTAFMGWFVENYPDSAKIMKKNPDYQYKFR